jgi:SNF2 family DNA or RNA helicase
MIPPLFDHQKTSIDFFKGKDRVFDASDPGTGKTRIAIEDFTARLAEGGGKALVIGPKSSLKSTWKADFKKFAPNVHVECAYARNREEAFWTDANVYVTNHDATKWLAKQNTHFFDGFDTLIVDEIGAFKHATSQRSKALIKIKDHFTHRLGMNGTPTPNTITDIWHQMFIIDDGQRLGNSFFRFRQATCTPKQVGPSANMLKWEDKEGAADAVSKLMEDITIRHIFEECLSIPKNFQYAVPYTLTPKQQAAYAQMKEQQIALLSETKVIDAVNAAAVATKLLQISSGAVYDSNGDAHIVDTERYDMVIDLAEQRKHSVVFFLWKHQKEQLIAEAIKRKISYCLIDGTVSDTKRNQAIELYQQGMYRICFAHPQSAAHSLTLTKGTATVWPCPTYNLEHYQQGFRRIYRAGQTQKTETIVVVAENTIEEQVWEALQNKKVKMDDLLNQLTETA